MDTASIIGLLVWFCCILYSSIRYFTTGYIRGQYAALEYDIFKRRSLI
jgi:hypothetical protein